MKNTFNANDIKQIKFCDLVIDPYTQAANGKVRLIINAFFDAKVLRTGAIKVATVA